jgi:hypothetical protein
VKEEYAQDRNSIRQSSKHDRSLVIGHAQQSIGCLRSIGLASDSGHSDEHMTLSKGDEVRVHRLDVGVASP